MATLEEKQAELTLLRKREELAALRAQQESPQKDISSKILDGLADTGKAALNVTNKVLSPVTTIADALGVPKGPPLSSAFPNAFADPGKGENWYTPEKGGLLDVTPGGIITGAGDMAAGAFGPAEIKLLMQLGGKSKAILAKLSGLTPMAAETLATAAPQANKIAQIFKSKMGFAGLQDEIKAATNATKQNVLENGVQNAATAKEILAGHQVPIDIEHLKTLAEAGDQNAELLYKQATGQAMDVPAAAGTSINVPGDEAYRLRQFAGKQAYERGTKNPITGKLIAQDPALGAAHSQLKKNISAITADDAGKMVDSLAEDTVQGIDLQKALKPADRNPIAAVGTNSPDKIANFERLAQDYGQTSLGDLHKLIQTGKELAKPLPGGVNLNEVLGNLPMISRWSSRKLLPYAERARIAAEALPGGTAASPWLMGTQAGINSEPRSSTWDKLPSNIGDEK